MGLYQGSFRSVGDASAADVVILDAAGNPVFGFDSSRPASATVVVVPSSATDVPLLVANPLRRQFIIQNVSSKPLYVTYGGASTLTMFTQQIAAGGAYESPLNGFTGAIHGIWKAVNGNAVVTEVF